MKNVLFAAMMLLQSIAARMESGVITGRLQTASGAPAAGVRVAAMAASAAEANAAVVTVLVRIAETDIAGRYRLENVPAGSYFISAGSVSIPTFYPSVSSQARARIVTIAGGDTITGIDFSVLSPSGASVSGRFVPSSIPGAPGFPQVVVLSSNGQTFQAPVNADGTFEFPKVAPGSYTLRNDGSPFGVTNPVSITVAGEDVIGVQLPLLYQTEVFGRVGMEDGSPLPTSQDLYMSAQGQGRGTSTRLQVGGAFRLRLIEGEQRLAVRGFPPGYAIKSITAGGIVLSESKITINGPAVGDSIIVTLTLIPEESLHGVTVRGRMTNLPPASYIHEPKIRFSSESFGGPAMETTMNPDGSFEFSKVPPGVYSFQSEGIVAIAAKYPTVTVGDSDITGVTITLSGIGNPFPEFPAGSFSMVFNSLNTATIQGVVTLPVTQIRPPSAVRFFQLDETNEIARTVRHWSILCQVDDVEADKIKVGMTVTIVVNPAIDGTLRAYLIPSGMTVSSPPK